jgi:MYXO-CTERM domain-containing protein
VPHIERCDAARLEASRENDDREAGEGGGEVGIGALELRDQPILLLAEALDEKAGDSEVIEERVASFLAETIGEQVVDFGAHRPHGGSGVAARQRVLRRLSPPGGPGLAPAFAFAATDLEQRRERSTSCRCRRTNRRKERTMTRLLLTGACVAALALPLTAAAKGPSTARISGPGLDSPLTVSGNAEGGTGPLAMLTMEGGFFQTTFGQTPDSRLPGKPSGDLGPRYTVDYTVPGPMSVSDHITQDLYPYARGGPVTYTPHGQRFFGTEKTIGGWYRASAELKRMLVERGLPRSAAPAKTVGGISVGDPGPLAGIVAAALLLAAAGALLLRRQRRPTP